MHSHALTWFISARYAYRVTSFTKGDQASDRPRRASSLSLRWLFGKSNGDERASTRKQCTQIHSRSEDTLSAFEKSAKVHSDALTWFILNQHLSLKQEICFATRCAPRYPNATRHTNEPAFRLRRSNHRRRAFASITCGAAAAGTPKRPLLIRWISSSYSWSSPITGKLLP